MNEVQKFTELEIKSTPCPRRGEYVEKNVPYFCSHRADDSSYSGYGRVIKSTEGFTLVDIGLNKMEDHCYTTVQSDPNLTVLVNRWDIRRLKAKVILYKGDE